MRCGGKEQRRVQHRFAEGMKGAGREKEERGGVGGREMSRKVPRVGRRRGEGRGREKYSRVKHHVTTAQVHSRQSDRKYVQMTNTKL